LSRVAVVGGGLAGIAAALRCADRGAAVTLFERRQWLGGATFSFERNGVVLDNGQHVFLRCCTAYLDLVDRLGVRDRVVLQPRLDVPVLAPGGRSGRLRRGTLPAPLQLGGSLLRYPHLGALDKARLGRVVLDLRRLDLDDPSLDGESFGVWLRERGQGDDAIEGLWGLITLPTVNLPVDEASLALAATVFRLGLIDAADAADIGYATVPLREVHGDAAALALSVAGADVRLGTSVQAIDTDGASVALTVDGETFPADAVVVAVPHEAAAGLLPAGTLPPGVEPARLGSSPIVNVHVAYDRRVTDYPFAAAVRSPVQWVFDRTDAAGLDRGQLLAVSLSAAREHVSRSVAELRAVFEPALAELLPGARAARVRWLTATREPHATFRGVPGSARHRPAARTLHPRVLLAGAWTATGWPATMESAVRSGAEAAEAALLVAPPVGPVERVAA
jgi:squalene-associated FAD-dependent desaturase